MKKNWHRKAMLVRGLNTGNLVQHRVHVPEDVKSDWAARSRLQHHSITAELLGDPLPGYSAFDRKIA